MVISRNEQQTKFCLCLFSWTLHSIVRTLKVLQKNIKYKFVLRESTLSCFSVLVLL